MSLSLIAPMCCRNHAMKSVLDHFSIQVEIPKRKRNAETFFTRELLLCFIRKHKFLCAIFGTKFEGNDANLRIKSGKLKKFHFR